MNTLKLAIRNVFRNHRRTLLTLFSIASGIAAILLYQGFVTYSMWGLRESTIRSGVGHIQVSTEDAFFLEGNFDPFSFLLPDESDLARKITAIPHVKAVVPKLSFSATLSSGEKSGIVIAEAVPVDDATSILSFRRVIEGRDILASGAAEVVLAEGVARKLQARVGDRLTMLATSRGGGMNAVDLQVVGISSSGIGAIDNISIYLELATAKELLNVETVPQLIVTLDETERTEQVRRSLEGLRLSDGRPLAVRTWEQLADFYRQAKGFYASLVEVIKAIVIAVVVFSIVNTMLMTVFERFREIGTLRAIGTRKRGIMALFLAEGAVLGVLGGFFGVLVAVLAAWVLNRLGGIHISPPPGMSQGYTAEFWITWRSALEGFLIAVVVSTVSSIYPSRKAVRISIADALRYL